MNTNKYETKGLSVTIPTNLYNLLLNTFEISNQDDLDQCIQSFIEDKIDKEHLEYSNDKGMQQMSDYAEKQSEAS
jgi:hypothetical protein